MCMPKEDVDSQEEAGPQDGAKEECTDTEADDCSDTEADEAEDALSQSWL